MEQKEYIDSIQTLAKQIVLAVNNSPVVYDQTYAGMVESVSASGKYSVTINEVSSEMYSNSDAQFKAGDKVWITAPCGNRSKQYISGRRR